MRPVLAVMFAVLLSSPAIAAGDDAAMAAAASGFYDVYKTFHPSDGIPGDSDRAKYQPFITSSLETSLEQAAAAEARFAKANKDSPPLIEGDLFTSLFEGATAVTVGACTGNEKTGQCAVDLAFTDATTKPFHWTDTVYLANTGAGWRIDDIGYGGSWAFGNKGRLSATLRQVSAFQ
jgi:hypothetical protein